MTYDLTPTVSVAFDLDRQIVVVSWFDGIESKSRIVHLRESNPFARITEVTDNAIRAILNRVAAIAKKGEKA